MAPSAIGIPKLPSTEDDAISMPPEPSVSVPAPVTPMPDAALATLMPLQDRDVPKVRPAPSEVLNQVAMSLDPGAVLPLQLAPSVRSVPVAALVMGAACEPVTRAIASKAAMKPAGAREWLRAFMPGWLAFFMGLDWRIVGESMAECA